MISFRAHGLSESMQKPDMFINIRESPVNILSSQSGPICKFLFSVYFTLWIYLKRISFNRNIFFGLELCLLANNTCPSYPCTVQPEILSTFVPVVRRCGL